MKSDEKKDPGHVPDDKAPPAQPPGQAKDKNEKKVDLVVVVNGNPIDVKAKTDEPLSEVRDEALKKSTNVGQPPENWEIKTEDGAVLDLTKPVGEFDFADGTTLFLSLKAGVAGV